MARLKECPDCGATVSIKAASCPKCGRPLKKAAKQYGCCGLIVGLGAASVLVVALLAIVSSGGRPAERPAAVKPETVGGLTESRRREIYQAAWWAGMKASRQAESEYPASGAPSDVEGYRVHADARKALYDSVKAKNRAGVMDEYRVTPEQLEAIYREGGEKKWPLREE